MAEYLSESRHFMPRRGELRKMRRICRGFSSRQGMANMHLSSSLAKLTHKSFAVLNMFVIVAAAAFLSATADGNAAAADVAETTMLSLADPDAVTPNAVVPNTTPPAPRKPGELGPMISGQATNASTEQKGDYFGVDWERESPDESIHFESIAEYFRSLPFPPCGWTIDYRLRSFCSSQTSYEVGTPDDQVPGWMPLSMLRFGLDSPWHGLAVGYNRPNWAVSFEWMAPLSDHVNGELVDYDWNPPTADGSFTDLGHMRERWNDGQTINLNVEYHLCDRVFGLPVEVWPLAGFRWQRFNLTAYQLDQILFEEVWAHRIFEGDIITFNQQYYMCCVGGQLRKTFLLGNMLPMRLTFQGDWGAAWGYNVDHHLLRDVYSTMSTQGSSWHIAFTAEAPFTEHLSLGFQVDYLNIRTTGTEHYFSRPEQTDLWRTNGVCAYSDQTTLTVFLQLRM
jgi:hypothetical protein